MVSEALSPVSESVPDSSPSSCCLTIYLPPNFFSPLLKEMLHALSLLPAPLALITPPLLEKGRRRGMTAQELIEAGRHPPGCCPELPSNRLSLVSAFCRSSWLSSRHISSPLSVLLLLRKAMLTRPPQGFRRPSKRGTKSLPRTDPALTPPLIGIRAHLPKKTLAILFRAMYVEISPHFPWRGFRHSRHHFFVCH